MVFSQHIRIDTSKKLIKVVEETKQPLTSNITHLEKFNQRLTDDMKKVKVQQEDLAILITKAATKEELKSFVALKVSFAL